MQETMNILIVGVGGQGVLLASEILSEASMTAGFAIVDLFAGPGRYKDGASSTPLLILEQAIKDPKMAEMLTTFFNDGDASHALSLKNAIEALPGIKSIKQQTTGPHTDAGDDNVKK